MAPVWTVRTAYLSALYLRVAGADMRYPVSVPRLTDAKSINRLNNTSGLRQLNSQACHCHLTKIGQRCGGRSVVRQRGRQRNARQSGRPLISNAVPAAWEVVSAVYDRLVDLLVDRFEVDRAAVGPDVVFADLDVDSLFLVELLLVAQSEFADAELAEDLVAPSDTIGRAAELIERRLTTAASP